MDKDSREYKLKLAKEIEIRKALAKKKKDLDRTSTISRKR